MNLVGQFPKFNKAMKYMHTCTAHTHVGLSVIHTHTIHVVPKNRIGDIRIHTNCQSDEVKNVFYSYTITSTIIITNQLNIIQNSSALRTS